MNAHHLGGPGWTIQLATLLVSGGADVNGLSSDGRFALEIAAGAGSVEYIDFLVSHGANLELRSASNQFPGSTALHFASYTANATGVKRLLELGAKVNALNDTNETPLMTLAWNDGEQLPPTEAMTLLMKFGADPNLKDNYGKTALSGIWGGVDYADLKLAFLRAVTTH